MLSMPEELFKPNKTVFFDQLFEKLDLVSTTIKRKEFENCRFTQCNFDNATLCDCRFIDCEFVNCTLNTTILTNTVFLGVSFDSSKLMGINWTTNYWPNIVLSSPINFYACDISHSSFMGLNLSEINIQNCKAHDVDFREADLSRGNLTNSDFYQSWFIHTKLMGADFTDAANYNIDVRLNDIKGAVFTLPDVINLLENLEIKINRL